MTTQNAAPPAQDKKRFDAKQYALGLSVVGIAYVFILAGITLLTILLGHALEQLIQRVFFTTVFHFIAALIITTVAKPAYVPNFHVKPMRLASGAVMAGSVILIVWFYRKQVSEEGRLQLILALMLFALVVLGTRKFVSAWVEEEQEEGHLAWLPYGIIGVGTIAGTLFMPRVLEIYGTVVQLWADLVIVLFGIILMAALWVLDTLSTPDVKPTPIPDGYAGVVRAKGRIQRVSFGKTIDVKVKGEDFEKKDVRRQTSHVAIHDCLTADHAYVDVDTVVAWQPVETEAGLTAFITSAADPLDMLKAACSSAMRSEIGQRDSRFISGREVSIADKVTKLVATTAKQYGVQHAQVIITHARLKYLMPGEGISPLAEASRLRTLDSAVRSASKTTVKHAETMANAEASARAGKEEKEKSEDNKPHSF